MYGYYVEVGGNVKADGSVYGNYIAAKGSQIGPVLVAENTPLPPVWMIWHEPVGIYASVDGGCGGYFDSTAGGDGVHGRSADANGVSGKSTHGTGVDGRSTSENPWVSAVYGLNQGAGDGVYGKSKNRYGVYGVTQSSDPEHAGVYGICHGSGLGTTPAAPGGRGVHGEAWGSNGVGIFGRAVGTGVYGKATGEIGTGGHFVAEGHFGEAVCAEANGNYGIGVLATAGVHYGTGGEFHGNGEGGTGVRAKGGKYDFYAAGPGGDYVSKSYIRWKTKIRPIDDPLDKVLRMRGIYFDWDAEHGGHHDVGMVAEEVGEVLPEIVGYEENGMYATGMDYSKLTPLLVEAVKALKREADESEKKLAEKCAEIAELKARMLAFEARVGELTTHQGKGQ